MFLRRLWWSVGFLLAWAPQAERCKLLAQSAYDRVVLPAEVVGPHIDRLEQGDELRQLPSGDELFRLPCMAFAIESGGGMAEDDSGQEESALSMRLTSIEDRLMALEALGGRLRDYVVGQAYGVPRSHLGPHAPPVGLDSGEPGPAEPPSDYETAWLARYHC